MGVESQMSGVPGNVRAIQLTGHGGPDMLKLTHDMPTPTPDAGEVLIKTGAAGLNNTDINTRVGWYSKGDGNAEDARSDLPSPRDLPTDGDAPLSLAF